MNGAAVANALLARAERLIEKAAVRGLEAEVYLEQGRGLDAEIEKGVLSGMNAHGSGGGAWRVIQDGRLGFAYFADDGKAIAALDAALVLSRLAPAKGFHFPAPSKATTLPSRWDGAIAEPDPAALLASAKALIAGAREAEPKLQVSGGGAGLSWGASALANTHGVRAADAATMAGASVSVILEEGESAISTGEMQSSHRFDLDPHAIGHKAGATARSLRSPKPARAGVADIIFRPEACMELVAGLAVAAATGDEAMRGKTMWSGKLGQAVANPALSILDDPLDPAALGAVAFDDEGAATRRIPIVEKGVLRNYLFDGWDAAEHKQASTASAVRGGWTARPTTDTHHLTVEGPSSDLDKLVAGVEEGFLVESVLGAHTANETTGEFSVTAPNVWRIHKGALAGAVSDIAIGSDLSTMLRNADGVSRERRRMDGASIPHIRVRGLDVSV
ncbi:MAG: TldD/PmbA family protein [Candidatus Thermoplasmatota archaeon]